MNMKVTAAPGTVLADVLGAKQTTFTVAADGTLSLQVPPLSSVVLVPQGQVGGH
jgi:hypothetical protein